MLLVRGAVFDSALSMQIASASLISIAAGRFIGLQLQAELVVTLLQNSVGLLERSVLNLDLFKYLAGTVVFRELVTVVDRTVE